MTGLLRFEFFIFNPTSLGIGKVFRLYVFMEIEGAHKMLLLCVSHVSAVCHLVLVTVFLLCHSVGVKWADPKTVDVTYRSCFCLGVPHTA